MKKFFTLVVAAFAAVNVFAQTKDIGEPKNNATEKNKDGQVTRVWYDSDTKTVTFHEKNSYMPGWWLASWDNTAKANVGTDYSDYDELVVEIDNPDKVDVNVRVEYDGKDVEASKANSTGNEIVVPLNKVSAKKTMQAYLQCFSDIEAGATRTITFKKAYFKANETGASTVLFEGEQAFSLWGDQVLVDKDKFANVKAGDKIIVTGKKGKADASVGWKDEWGGQIYLKTKRSGWSSLGDNLIMTDASAQYIFKITDDEITIKEEQVDPNDETKKIKVDVKTTILKELQEYGLAIQGMASVMTKVELVTSGEATNISNSVVAPAAKSAKIYNLAGQQVDASYKGVVIKDGKKYVQK